jgi:hypothetical protein
MPGHVMVTDCSLPPVRAPHAATFHLILNTVRHVNFERSGSQVALRLSRPRGHSRDSNIYDVAASVAPEDRAHCWTLTGWSSTRYKNTSIWGSGSRRMAGGTTMTRPSIRCAQRMAIGGRCWHVPVSRLECACSCYRPCLLSGHVRSRGLGLYTVDARANVGGSQEGRARHLGTAPMDCSCDALYGDTDHGLARSSMRRKFAGMTMSARRRGRWIKCALDFSYTGRRWPPQGGTDWTQSLQKAVHGTDRAEHR